MQFYNAAFFAELHCAGNITPPDRKVYSQCHAFDDGVCPCVIYPSVGSVQFNEAILRGPRSPPRGHDTVAFLPHDGDIASTPAAKPAWSDGKYYTYPTEDRGEHLEVGPKETVQQITSGNKLAFRHSWGVDGV